MPQNPAHNSIDVSGWHIAVVPNNAPYAQFIVDSATVTCTGPGANPHFSNLLSQIRLFSARYSQISGLVG